MPNNWDDSKPNGRKTAFWTKKKVHLRHCHSQFDRIRLQTAAPFTELTEYLHIWNIAKLDGVYVKKIHILFFYLFYFVG